MKLRSLKLRKLEAGEKCKNGDWILGKSDTSFPTQITSVFPYKIPLNAFSYYLRIEYPYPKAKKKKPKIDMDRTHLSRNIDLGL